VLLLAGVRIKSFADRSQENNVFMRPTCTQPHSLLASGSRKMARLRLTHSGDTLARSSNAIIVGALPAGQHHNMHQFTRRQVVKGIIVGAGYTTAEW